MGRILLIIGIITLASAGCWTAEDSGGPLVVPDGGLLIDHRHVDWTLIPDSHRRTIRETAAIHLAHTSHGEQLPAGLDRLASLDESFAFRRSYCILPADNDRLCMIDGQYLNTGGYCETYVTPDLYWQGAGAVDITRWMLQNHNINVTIWTWCSQLDYFSETETDAYLNALSSLEAEFPDVVFVYLTGNAQAVSTNRLARNNQIRDFCRENEKVLFDFADLDCWYNGHQHTVDGIPCEHPHYSGDEAGHTTLESCQQKAAAFWWMLARLSGWEGT